jgi:hypothetical protein
MVHVLKVAAAACCPARAGASGAGMACPCMHVRMCIYACQRFHYSIQYPQKKSHVHVDSKHPKNCICICVYIYMCVCSSNVGDSKHHETSIANPQTLKSMPLCTRLQRSVPVVPYDLFRRVRSFPGPPRAETKGCGEILGSASAKTRVYMCISYVCTQKIVHVYV